MPLLIWSEQFSVNIPSIDEQHARWVELINELHEAMREGKGKDILTSIVQASNDYGKTHLAYEEALMKKHGYPEFTGHKALHDNFLRYLAETRQKLDSGEGVLTISIMNIMKNWLVEHIQNADKKYSRFLVDKGVR